MSENLHILTWLYAREHFIGQEIRVALTDGNVIEKLDVSLTVHRRQYLEIKGQLDATDWFFIEKFIIRSTCFGHHYVHHQELKIYTDGCCLWYLKLGFTGRWSGVELWVMCPVCGMFLDWLYCYCCCNYYCY
jgi:hypothetical protein